MKLRLRMRQNFFDREKVIRALDKGQRIALSKAGAFIRTSARMSMRPGRRKDGRRIYSKPGEPPRVWQGNLKKFTFFAYDEASKSVVVGPEGFSNSEAPRVLEYGGAVQYRKKIPGTKETIAATATLEPRPFMQPAFEKNKSQIPEHWRDVVKG